MLGPLLRIDGAPDSDDLSDVRCLLCSSFDPPALRIDGAPTIDERPEDMYLVCSSLDLPASRMDGGPTIDERSEDRYLSDSLLFTASSFLQVRAPISVERSNEKYFFSSGSDFPLLSLNEPVVVSDFLVPLFTLSTKDERSLPKGF